MKEDFDKEMDSLLRRRARGVAESRAGGDGSAAAHLDADELGAFAEGALPAPARLAAALHLADCDECRGIAVGLARVTGGVEETKKQAVAATAAASAARPATWRKWFGSLFAPRVLRFAAPVLALSLVAVVSLIALRTKNGGALRSAIDARRQGGVAKEQPKADLNAPAGVANANSNVGGLVEPEPNVATRDAEARRSAATQAPAGGGHGAAEAPPVADTTREDASPQPPPPPAASPEVPREVMSKAAPRPVTVDGSETTRTENREKAEENKDKSARAAEPAEEVAANDAPPKRAAQSRANEVQMQMPDGSRNQKRAADNSASNVYGSGGALASPPKESERDSSRGETARRARSAPPAGRKSDEDDERRAVETRAAAGHRFRRVGSAWIDVNYKSSMPSTGVRRGTEAFRALVADVPEVGRVAEQIGGEVIIVVGRRAYHIR